MSTVNPAVLRNYHFFEIAALALTTLSLLNASPARAAVATVVVPGAADPWLAGMPDGSTASSGDTAPAQSPVEVTGLTLKPGSALTFQATGSVSYSGTGGSGTGPDGQGAYSHANGAENGISDITYPVEDLVGVFLGPDQPDKTPAPNPLDFSTPDSQNFAMLSPALKQVFFIGDGLTADGKTQQFVVPAGATRLYLGTGDGAGWYDNGGSFTVQVSDQGVGQAVSPPSAASVSLVVPGTADPWLAGMPDGSTASDGDAAPAQSPVEATGLTLTAGSALTFQVTGTVNYGGGPDDPPDGSGAFPHADGAQNGISDVTYPGDSLVGVFLGPDQPDKTPAPNPLDFSTPDSQNFATLSPALKQVFFIGDGLTADGKTQQFVVPAGATRLYLGTADGTGWYNNTGSFNVVAGGSTSGGATPPTATGEVTVDLTVPGAADPWLAGMPDGSTASDGDAAPVQSPVEATGLSLTAGSSLTFQVSGSVSYAGSDPATDPPDGSGTVSHATGAENGISSAAYPGDALLGVFLGAAQPDKTPAPDASDFSTSDSQNFMTLSPALKQVFFIGDGLTADGKTQRFVVPAGATRLYLGTGDGEGWYNNTGAFAVKITGIGATSGGGGTTGGTVLIGDLNGDGKVNVQDATLSLRLAVGLLTPTDAQKAAGDVNGDGKWNIQDTTLILQVAVGLKSGFLNGGVKA